MAKAIFWFRRDLRLADNPALNTAIEQGDEIVPVFILDEKLIKQTGSKRLAYLGNSLLALDESLNGNLHVMVGDQVEVHRGGHSYSHSSRSAGASSVPTAR